MAIEKTSMPNRAGVYSPIEGSDWAISAIYPTTQRHAGGAAAWLLETVPIGNLAPPHRGRRRYICRAERRAGTERGLDLHDIQARTIDFLVGMYAPRYATRMCTVNVYGLLRRGWGFGPAWR